MPDNRVNAVLSPEDKTEIIAALKLIRQKLPFLIDLSKAQRKTMAKMGDARYSFVHQTLGLAEEVPDMLPRSFNVEDFRRDVDLLEALRGILFEANRLRNSLDDTTFALANEAYTSARTVYRFAKADRGHGLDGILKEMGKTFPQRIRKKVKLDQSDGAKSG